VWRFVLLHEVLHPARSTELSDVPVANISSLSYSGHAIQVFAPFFQNQHLPLRISPRPHYPTQFLYLPAKHPQGELTDSEHQAWSLQRKNASQSGQDPCLLSRKRKKEHHLHLRKAWCCSRRPLGRPYLRHSILFSATALGIDWLLSIYPHPHPTSSMGKIADRGS